jgi:hypothetical protein
MQSWPVAGRSKWEPHKFWLKSEIPLKTIKLILVHSRCMTWSSLKVFFVIKNDFLIFFNTFGFDLDFTGRGQIDLANFDVILWENLLFTLFFSNTYSCSKVLRSWVHSIAFSKWTNGIAPFWANSRNCSTLLIIHLANTVGGKCRPCESKVKTEQTPGIWQSSRILI